MTDLSSLLSIEDSLRARIPISTVGRGSAFVLKNGSLMSMISVDGAIRGAGRKGLERIADELSVVLASMFSAADHSVEFAFVRDPILAEGMIRSRCRGMMATADRLGMNADDLCGDQRNHLRLRTVWETVALSVWTRASSSSSAGSSDRAGSRSKAAPQHDRHATATQALCSGLVRCGLKAEVMPWAAAMHLIQTSICPEMAPDAFKFLQASGSSREAGGSDASPAARMPTADWVESESLDWRLAAAGGRALESGLVSLGDHVFASFDVTAAPERLTPFNVLVASIHNSCPRLRWRCSFMLDYVNMSSFHPREQFAHLFGFASPSRHRRIRAAFEYLRQVEDSGDKVVRLRITFSTWSHRRDVDALHRNALLLRRSVEHWGNAAADSNSGDPVATMLASIPGLTCEKTAPAALAPLGQLLILLPVARAACPWKFGETVFRSEDGRLWNYRRGSLHQANWAEICVGVSGSGKSMAMNVLNLNSALSARAGESSDGKLPRIGILDVGNSSEGLVRLVQQLLPPQRRDEAAYCRLKMLASHAINPFDTPLGMRHPQAGERMFLTNFLSVLLNAGAAENADLAGLFGSVVDQCYQTRSDEFSPRRYEAGVVPAVDEALRKDSTAVTGHTTWWQVVDALFQAGRVAEAKLAQTQAVPLLDDMLLECRSPRICDLYGGVAASGGESSLLRKVHRVVSEAIRNFPVLSSPTRFETGAARILSIDLEEVSSNSTQPSAMRTSALMYMLARHAIVRGWAVRADEVMPAIRSGRLPEVYARHHLKLAAAESDAVKYLCVDEFHRVNRIEGVQRQIVQDIREGRKHNVHVSLASQFLEDFPSQILNSSTSVFVFSSQSRSACDALNRSFGLRPAEVGELRRDREGPGAAGARLVALFRTKAGLYCQNLVLDPSPLERWAFATTREDAELRDRASAAMDPWSARRMLALRFPEGTAKPEIERRLSWNRSRRLDGRRAVTAGGIIDDLIAELRQLLLLGKLPGHASAQMRAGESPDSPESGDAV